MAESENREIIWTRSALADLKAICEFMIPVVGEEKAYQLIELIKEKTEALQEPVTGSSRFISKRHPKRSYQKFVIKPYILIFRQIG
jgi:plasmid stabilization system protein ParE